MTYFLYRFDEGGKSTQMNSCTLPHAPETLVLALPLSHLGHLR